MTSQLKKVELKHSESSVKWKTPKKRKSQSISATSSPSGRYFFVSYLFGLDVLDTGTGEEIFYLIHPDQDILNPSEFNICGYVAISDTVGYTIERTSETYGDFYLRRIEFKYDLNDYDLEERPINLAFHVKWLTSCFDYNHETQELNLILRHEIEPINQINDQPDYRMWWSYKLIDKAWRKIREPVRLPGLDAMNSWDWFPKLYDGSLYLFPVQATISTVHEKLQQLNQIAKIDIETGMMKMLPIKGGLEKWAEGENFADALFVDNMDFKWIGSSLFLLFVIAFQDEQKVYSFQNRMATFDIDKMEWRSIEINNFCNGSFDSNPYRMHVASNNHMYIRGHPCTTFGSRDFTPRQRCLWVPPAPNTEEINNNEEDISIIYSIPLGLRKPVVFRNAVEKTLQKCHPQLVGRPFYEFPQLLSYEPPRKRAKINRTNDEMVGAGACKS